MRAVRSTGRRGGGKRHVLRGDQALRILGETATPAERAILGAVRYQDNVAMLHTDAALLPRRRQVWSAWNNLGGQGGAGGEVVDDATLAARVRTALAEQNIVDGAAISVSVEGGRVTLAGDLRPYQIPLADGLVRRVEGVHEVDNRLRATTGVP